MNREIQDYELLPMRCEFLVIGGGLTGSSLAYWIKQRFRDENVTVSVVENTENVA
jgi:protoporphyrinogen oxidase